MKTMMCIPAAIMAAVMLSSCDGTTTSENAQARVDAAKQMTADSNAELMMQNAQNYCASCASYGVKLQSGRYAGSPDRASDTPAFDGSRSDFDKAFDTYTNGMTSGYYAVMIDNGAPTAAYWSESDLSSVDFKNIPEGMVVGVKIQ
ncbi:MAG: hypothetical protein IKR73_09235 [Oscillospiraceae bacterium]|nr:hypothetical protein [Oscillospiraceae bacterium]